MDHPLLILKRELEQLIFSEKTLKHTLEYGLFCSTRCDYNCDNICYRRNRDKKEVEEWLDLNYDRQQQLTSAIEILENNYEDK